MSTDVDEVTAGDSLEPERLLWNDESPSFSLVRAVGLLARVDGREPNLDGITGFVDAQARLVAERVDKAGPIEALHDVVFGTFGLRGDHLDYDHPRNSFLDDVIQRHQGLPIALSVLLVGIAEQASIKAWGLNLPGHFVAAVFVDPERFVVVDPFASGALIAAEDVARRAGVPPSELGEVLLPASAHTILTRMLVNLRTSYMRRGDNDALVRVLNRLILLRGPDPSLLLQRAEGRRLLLDDVGAHSDLTAARELSLGDEDVLRGAQRIEEELAKGEIVN